MDSLLTPSQAIIMNQVINNMFVAWGGECENLIDVPCDHLTVTAEQQDTNIQEKQVTPLRESRTQVP